ncbi:MAG: hypothetical protein KBT11_00745 [Treponema sp.]|nr:hypothetical protein [Candidatus Treponema equifaecale]
MAENKNQEKSEWYNVKQNHNFGYKAMLVMLKILPAPFMRSLAFPIGFFYWLFGKSTRRVSKEYLRHVGKKSTFNHIISFALNLVENIQSWAGKFSFEDLTVPGEDIHDLWKNVDSGRGIVIMISHLGNAQMMKGLAALGESGTAKKMSITTIFDTEISSGLNSLLNQINAEAGLRLVNSNDIGPETILLLQERLEQGEVIVVAGDRVGAYSDRYITMPFLGEEADFPYGAFLLLALLNAPTYFLNGLRKKDISIFPEYEMYVKKNSVDFNCGRKEREERIRQTAENYRNNLEELCRKHPYQWYNFYDFWK